MAIRWAIASGDFSSTATWNDGATLGIPTVGDDVWSNGFTVNMDVNATVNSMNNSARARDIATPLMNANNAPSPYIVFGTGANPSLAFNRNYTDGWQSGVYMQTGIVGFDFSTNIIIDGYRVFGSNDFMRNPRNWTFEGSNNNSTWTVLHTVTQASAIPSNGNYAVASIGNSTAYRYYRLNITASGGHSDWLNVAELELYQSGTVALASGGSFNFNTSGVTVNVTSTSASLSAGATNLITVTATVGTVTLSLGSSVAGLSISNTQIFSYTGACNFTLNGIRFIGGTGANAYCINKSSTGTINITGRLIGGTSGNQNTNALFSNSGNSVVIGDIFGGGGGNGLTPAIAQSAGNLTVTGNVFGGNLTANNGITYTGSNSVTINGNVFGGFGGVGAVYGISTTGALIVNGNVNGGFWPAIISTSTVTITGTVTAAVQAAIISTSANTITVIGDVYASATANGISSTNANGIVNLTGNMYNGLGRNAIYCQNVFISNSATTLWRMDTGGGNYKTLYSADSFPNMPAIADVESNTIYGPGNSLTGTMIVPSISNTRKGVPVGNATGTAELTPTDWIDFLQNSNHDIAVRWRNNPTVDNLINILKQYNFI